jgi:hypothetical protein
MPTDEERYTCCQCDADMTDEVRKACANEGPFPMIAGIAPATPAKTVILQCPKGHSCEYVCL